LAVVVLRKTHVTSQRWRQASCVQIAVSSCRKVHRSSFLIDFSSTNRRACSEPFAVPPFRRQIAADRRIPLNTLGSTEFRLTDRCHHSAAPEQESGPPALRQSWKRKSPAAICQHAFGQSEAVAFGLPILPATGIVIQMTRSSNSTGNSKMLWLTIGSVQGITPRDGFDLRS